MAVADLDARLAQDPEAGREQLRRWLKDGAIRIGPTKDGAIAAEGAMLPLIVISDGRGRKDQTLQQLGGFGIRRS